VLAVLAAMAVALTVTPALSLILLSNARLDERQSPLVTWLQSRYELVLGRTAQRPRLAYALAALLGVVAVVMLPLLKQKQLLPSFQEPYLSIQLDAPPGTSLPAMNQIVSQASSELRAISGVRNVGAHVGRAVVGDQVVNVNSAGLWVSIDPSADYEATKAAVQRMIEGHTEVDGTVQTYLQQVLNQPQTNAKDGITVRVFGEDHDVLRGQAEKLQQALTGIAGVAGAHVALPLEEPTVEIEVNLDSAQRYGVKPGDVRRAAATLLSGIQVGSLFEEQKVFDVVVWGVPEIRDSLDDIGKLLIDTPGGGHVRLEEVADVRMASSPTVIHREGISPYLDIVFYVQGRDARAVESDLRAAIQNFAFPLEYHAVVQGDYAAQQATQQRILIAVIVTLFGILLFLHAAFRSLPLALVCLLTLPAALAGSVLAAFLGGGSSLFLGLMAGCLTILGITLRNGMLLINHYQYLEEKEGATFGPDLGLRGSRERFVPILMTAIATALALVPFVLFGNIPGHEIVRPVAIVILVGLVTSTLLNLFVLPALYLRFGATREADLGLHSAIPGETTASDALAGD
jgi:Cu/Ag efflux pump CusA